MHPDDARRAVDVVPRRSPCPTTAQQPRRHPGSIRVLPGIVDAVGDQIEVLQDGGIRRAVTW
jgi:L-lactate dehydrogenase (cytochrome)